MNPILSDLAVRISTIEAEAGLTGRQRLHVARTAAGTRAGIGSTLLNALRELVNPRQHALDVVAARERARPARPGRQPGRDAELPVAA
jgi:hypothetical protein